MTPQPRPNLLPTHVESIATQNDPHSHTPIAHPHPTQKLVIHPSTSPSILTSLHPPPKSTPSAPKTFPEHTPTVQSSIKTHLKGSADVVLHDALARSCVEGGLMGRGNCVMADQWEWGERAGVRLRGGLHPTLMSTQRPTVLASQLPPQRTQTSEPIDARPPTRRSRLRDA
ncbi:unnamed protein product [Cyclocybe aegerita]|uniref:Uncharacterized protein n=1 Tax=Cyclocybe aegerita TaxID=1973307 RepID=A0A8S0WUC6_CYCAE|nr:unnamed protein product [Cyclocybe aegerita]